MKAEYIEIAEAIRCEIDHDKDDVLIVFRVTDQKYKQFVKNNWLSDDMRFEIIEKKLVLHKDEK